MNLQLKKIDMSSIKDNIVNLQLKKFDMSSIKDNSAILILGNKTAGKSYLAKDVLFYNKDIPIGSVISPTEKENNFYSNFISPLFIHDEYSESIISNILKEERQKNLKKFENSGHDDLDRRTF